MSRKHSEVGERPSGETIPGRQICRFLACVRGPHAQEYIQASARSEPRIQREGHFESGVVQQLEIELWNSGFDSALHGAAGRSQFESGFSQRRVTALDRYDFHLGRCRDR